MPRAGGPGRDSADGTRGRSGEPDAWHDPEAGAKFPGARTLYPYVGGVGPFRAICQDVAEKGYEGLVLTRH
jgi:hypothetical protein